MRRILYVLSGAALTGAVALAGGCAGPQRVQWPDESARIDQDMAPPAQGEPIPEGIALGNDAPPLKQEPQPMASPYGAGIYGGGLGYGFFTPGSAAAAAAAAGAPGAATSPSPPLRGSAAPLPPPAPVAPSTPPPGGSIPGLLP